MSNNKYLHVFVKGMHCRSCEILVEDKLKELKRVESVDINYKTGEATLSYKGVKPTEAEINQAVCAAGYEIGRPEKLPLFSRDRKEYINLGAAFIFLIAAYFIFKGLGLGDINLGSSLSSPSWGLIVVIGLVAGFSTCMALIGGLSLGLSTKFADNHPQASAKEKFRPHLFFILGRILSYAFLGGILGVLGTVFQFSSLANGILTFLVGLVMLVMGLQLINILPRFSKYKFTLPKSISRYLGVSKNKKQYSHKQAMILGAMTFFLPCGFTQAMQLYAVSTGSIISGALIMALFAIGTAPGLLSIGGVTALVKGTFKERFFKAAGLAVIFFAVFNFNNAYTLASLSLGKLTVAPVEAQVKVLDPNVSLVNGVQVVKMVENNRGYSPSNFSIQKDVPVKWVIDAQAPYSCASSLVMPSLGIKKNLQSGENVIEFTATKVGKLSFSCSMGMYTGYFNVYDASEKNNINSLKNVSVATPSSSSGSCGSAASSCGSGCGCGGSGAPIETDKKITPASTEGKVQVIKTNYTLESDIQPNNFTIKVGQPVRFEITSDDDGSGCMAEIAVQGLYTRPQLLQAGKTVVMEFTPQKRGSYLIVCAMNIPRGKITVE
ncbi:MAG: sulfite exporter TauE/SafE family protein [Patescibacteria group bacterium]|nr:sulfite exporter TauE/SafE family protein [Patescibacteria group bacterium]